MVWKIYKDLRPDQTFIVYSGEERFPVAKGIEAISLRELTTELTAL